MEQKMVIKVPSAIDDDTFGNKAIKICLDTGNHCVSCIQVAESKDEVIIIGTVGKVNAVSLKEGFKKKYGHAYIVSVEELEEGKYINGCDKPKDHRTCTIM